MAKMTVKEYAALKNISESTVKNRINSKQIEAVQESGKYLIIVKDTRRVISPQEKEMRKEIRMLKRENKLLDQLRQERDQAVEEVRELRNKIEELHEKIHTIHEKKDEYFGSMYNELKGLKLAQKPQED